MSDRDRDLVAMARANGHGHVYPRSDGSRARCEGPGICRRCSEDLVLKQRMELRFNMETETEKLRAENERLRKEWDGLKDELAHVRAALAAKQSEALDYVNEIERLDAALAAAEERACNIDACTLVVRLQKEQDHYRGLAQFDDHLMDQTGGLVIGLRKRIAKLEKDYAALLSRDTWNLGRLIACQKYVSVLEDALRKIADSGYNDGGWAVTIAKDALLSPKPEEEG